MTDFATRVTLRPCRHRRIGKYLLLGIQFVLPPQLFSSTAAAEDKSEKVSAPSPELVQQLVFEVRELRARVSDLEGKLAAVGAPAEPEPSPVNAPVVATPAPSSPAPPRTPAPQDNGSGPLGVKLRLFGDVGYEVGDQKGRTNSFHLGNLDLFMAGNLSDRVSILGEVLFTPQSDNSITPDVERLLLQYKHSDHFIVAVGRYHTSIGYYNTAFHQGSWFQTAVDRPFMYAFDDQGGFLPLQEVGFTTSGAIPSEKLGLHYVAEIGNGRSHLLGSDPAQSTQDTNNGKSVNFALSSHPSWVPGLEAGFSVYHDRLTFSDNINHPELITTAWVVYNSSKYEFLNEVMAVRHGITSTGAPGVFHTPGFYTLFSRRFGKYRPYFRYSYINAGVDEPIYGDPADGALVGRRNGPSLGLRWDFNDHAAFKLQYDHLGMRAEKSTNGLQTQLSFAF